MARLLALSEREGLSPERQQTYDYLMETRGRVGGVWGVLLRSPEMALRGAQLGSYLRFDSPVDRKAREIAAIVASLELDNAGEANNHSRQAKEFGVAEDAVDALWKRDRSGLKGGDALAAKTANELITTHKLSDDTWNAAMKEWGEEGLVDMIGVIGYFAMLAYFYNAVGLND